jgi:hypothetical protein
MTCRLDEYAKALFPSQDATFLLRENVTFLNRSCLGGREG